jgi:hypothetical protein
MQRKHLVWGEREKTHQEETITLSFREREGEREGGREGGRER